MIKSGTSRKIVSKKLLSKKSILALAVAAAVAGVGLGRGPASAAVLSWDPGVGNAGTIGTALGGSGTWNAIGFSNWYNGAADTTWTDQTGVDTAVFAGTAGTVTLDNTNGVIAANMLDFTNTTGYLLTGGTLTMAGTTPTIAMGANSATISSTIAGTGVTVTGAAGGTLTLSGANTYTAGTTINGGAVSISASNNLGNNDSTAATGVAINAATLQVTGSGFATTRLYTLGNAASTIDVNGSALLELDNPTNSLTGTGGLTLISSGAGTGTLQLDTVANYTGGTTITSGTLLENVANALPNTALSVAAAGKLRLNGFNQAVTTLNGAGTVTSASGTPTFTVSGGGTFSGTLTGSLGLTASGGTLKLSGTNTYSGVTTATAGTLEFTQEVSLYDDAPANWTSANIIVGTGATLALGVGGAGQFTSADLDTILQTGSGGFAAGANVGIDTTGGSFVYNSNITDAGGGTHALGLVALGTNTLTLGGANSYSGGTTASAGTLVLSGTNSSAGGTTINGGATLQLDNATNGGMASGTLNLNGGTLQSLLAAQGVSNAVSLAASSTVSGAQSITFNGPLSETAGNTLTSSITGNSLTLGTVNIDAATGAALTLTVNGTGNTNFAGTIQDYNGGIGTAHGALTIGNTAGTVTLAGANTYEGATLINGAGGTTSLTGSLTGTNVTVNNATAILTESSAGVIAGAANTFTLTNGTVALAGTNTYGGITSIAAGKLTASNVQALGTSTATNALALSGGTLDLATDTSINAYNTTVSGTTTILSDKATTATGGITQTLGTLSIAGNTLNIQAGANVTGGSPVVAFSGTASVTGGATFNTTTAALALASVNTNGAYTLNFTGTANAFGTTVSGATTIGGNTVFSPSTANLTLNTVTSGVNNYNLTLQGTSTNSAINGAITTGSGTVSITNTAGTWTLAGANTYSGLTTINGAGGTMVFSGTNSSAGSVTLTNGTLDLDNTGANNGGLAGGTITLNGGIIDNITGSPLTLTRNNPVVWSNTFTFAAASEGSTHNINFGTGTLSLTASRTMTFAGTGTTLTFGNVAPTPNNYSITANGAGNTLVFNNSFAISTGGSSQVTLAGSANFNLAGVVSNGANTQGVTITDTGTVTLGNANTYTGLTTLNSTSGGTVILGSPTALGPATNAGIAFTTNTDTNTLNLNGNSITLVELNTNTTVSSTYTVQNASATPVTLTLNQSNNGYSFYGIMQDGTGGGALSFTKSGTNTLGWGGSGTYSGATIINGGTLNLATTNGKFSGTSSLTIDGGATFRDGDAGASANNNGINNRVNTAASLTLGGAIGITPTNGAGGVFNLPAAGTGAVSQTFSGPLTIGVGESQISSASTSATLTAALIFTGGAGGYVRNTGGFLELKTATGFNPQFTTAPTGSSVIGGVLVGAIITGGNTGILIGANSGVMGATPPPVTGTWGAGNNTQSGGNIEVTAAATTTNSLGMNANTISIDNGVTAVISTGMIYMIAGGAGTRTITNTSGTGMLTSGNGQDLIVYNDVGAGGTNPPVIINAKITDNGVTSIGLTLSADNNGSALTLGGANTFTGPTTINYVPNSSGTDAVLMTNSLALQDSTVTSYVTNGVQFSGISSATLGGLSGNTNEALTNAAAGAVNLSVGNNSASTTYSGVLGGTGGSLTKIGSGTLTLAGSNTYTGATAISAGTLKLAATGGLSATGTGISIAGGGTLDVSAFSPYTLPQNLSATGTGTATVNGSLNAGSHTIALQDGTNIGTLAFNSNLTLNAATLTFDLGNTSGSNDEITVGGTTSLTGTNIITAARLSSASAPTDGTYTLISTTGGFTGPGSFQLSSTGVVIGADKYTFSLGSTSTAEILTISSVLEPVWTGQTNQTYSTSTNWLNGGPPGSTTGTTSADYAIFDGSDTLYSGSTTVNIDSTSQNLGGIIFTNNPSISTPSAYTIGGAGANAGNPLFLSAGNSVSITNTTTFANPELFNAPIVLEGAYVFTNNSTFAAQTLTFAGGISAAVAGTTLTLNGTNTGTNLISGPISNGTGTLSLVEAGSSSNVWQISGNNTYTGSTAVTSGTLQLGSAGALGNGTLNTSGITVGAGGALDLNGFTPTASAVALSLNSSLSGTVGALTNSSATPVTYGGIVTLGGSAAIGGSAGKITLTSGLGIDAFTLTKVGSDTLLLNAASSRTGPVAISAGSLQVGAIGALGTGVAANTVAVSSGADLDLNGIAYSPASTLTLNGSFSGTAGALTNSSGTPAAYAGNVVLATASSIGGAGNITITGNLSGNFALTTVGAGTLTLTGTDSSTSTTTITLGTALQVGTGTTGGMPTGAVNNGGALFIDLSGALTVGATSGAGSITQEGSGTTTLGAADTYTGATSVTAGILKLGNAGALGNGTLNTSGVTVSNLAALDLNGITPTASVALNLNGTTAVGTVGALTNSSATAATYGGLVALQTSTSIGSSNGNITLSQGLASDNVTLTKIGTDTLVLGGTGSSRTGAVNISAGTLQVTNTGGSATGTGNTLTVHSGGTLAGSTAAGQGFIGEQVNIYGGGTLAAASGAQLTINGGGGLQLNADATSSALTFALNATPNGTGAGNGLINVTGTAGVSAALGSATVTITGTPSATPNSTYDLIGWSSGSLTTSNFNLAVTGPAAWSYTLANGSGQIDLITTPVTLTWTGLTGGTGAADSNWTTTGDTNWANGSAPVAYANPEFVSFGDSNAANSNATITNPAIIIQAAGVTPTAVTFNNSTAVAYNISNLSGTIGIAGATAVTLSGSGSVTFASANTYTGGTAINAGVLDIASDAALGTAPGTPTTNITFGVTGGTGGTLQEASSVNGTLTLNANRNITVGSGATATFDTQIAANTISYGGVVSGNNGGLTKVNSGTLSLTGIQAYTGTTNIKGGTLLFSNNGTIGTGAVVMSGGSTLQFTGLSGIGGLYTSPLATNNPTVALGGATKPNTVNLAQWSPDSASFTTPPVANGVVSYALNSVSGRYLMIYIPSRQAANDNYGSDFAAVAGGAVTVFNGATQVALPTADAAYAVSSSWNNGTQTPESIATGGHYQLAANGPGAAQPDFILIDLGSVQTLSQINIDWNAFAQSFATMQIYTTTGGVSQSIGSLSSSDPTTTVSIPNTTLTVGTDNTSTTFAGVINSTGGTANDNIIKIGSGTLTLGGANTYSGTTAVNAGKLTINGNQSSATGNVIVSNAGTILGGNGTIGGAVSIGAGTHLAPGGASPGTLTIANTLSIASGADLDYRLNNTTASGNDLISVTGTNNVSFAGTGTLNLTAYNGTLAIGNYVLMTDTGGIINGGVSPSGWTITQTGDAGHVYTLFETDSHHLDVNVNLMGITSAWTGAVDQGWATGGPTNWSNGIPGGLGTTNNLDTAVFNASAAAVNSRTSITVDATRNLQNITFDTANAAAYTIGSAGVNAGNTLSLSAAGSIQTTATVANPEVVNAPLIFEPFYSATAGIYSFTSGSTVSTSDTLTIAGNISGDSADPASIVLTLNGSNTGANTVSGLISNGIGVGATMSLAKAGTGTWYLTNGGNTYTGGTVLAGGILNFVSGSLGSGPITFTGGELQYAAGNLQDISAAISGSSTSAIFIGTNGNNVTFSNPIASTSVGLTVTDANVTPGTLTLVANNAYTGPTTILSGGTVAFSADGGASTNEQLGFVPAAATAGKIVINGGTLLDTLTTTLNANRGIAVGGAATGTISVAGGQVLTYTGIIANNGAGTGGLTVGGTGTFKVTGANTYSGGTTINSGATYQVGDNTTAVNGTLPGNVLDNGTLTIEKATTAAGNWSYTGVISGSGSLVIDGATGGSNLAVIFTLRNTGSSYSGGTTITQGVLGIEGTTSADTIVGAVPANAAVPNITLGNNIAYGNIGSTGGELMSYNGDNDAVQTVFGPTRTIQLNAGGGFFRGGYAIGFTIEGQITGSGPFGDVWDGGPIVLANNGGGSNGANNYTGDTIIGAATTNTNAQDYYAPGTALLRMGGSNQIPNGAGMGNVVFLANPVNAGNAATLDINGFNTQINALSGVASSVIDNQANNTLATLSVGSNYEGAGATTTFAGVIQNSGANSVLNLAKNGTGTLLLSGNNTYVGTTTISSGATIQLGNANALGFGGVTPGTAAGGSATVNSGGTLDLNGQSTINKVITLNGTGVGGNGALISSAGTAVIGNGVAYITGAAGSGITAPFTVTLSGTGTAAGSLGVTQASVTSVTPGTQTYTVAPTVTVGGGAGAIAVANLDVNGFVTSVTITNSGAGFTAAPTFTFAGGTILAAGTVPTATGNATEFALEGLAVTGAGSGYTTAPAVTFSSGTGNAGTAVISSVILGSDSSIGGAGNITINAGISGNAALSKVGAGTVTLNAAEAYTGATLVSHGLLIVGDASHSGASIGGSGVTVGNGGILGGHGSINAPVTVQPGGALTPGGSIGTTTYSAGLDLSSATTAAPSTLNYTLGTPGSGIPSVGGIGSLIAVTGGTLALPALGASLNLNLTDNAGANSQGSIGVGTYELFSYTGATLTGGTGGSDETSLFAITSPVSDTTYSVTNDVADMQIDLTIATGSPAIIVVTPSSGTLNPGSTVQVANNGTAGADNATLSSISVSNTLVNGVTNGTFTQTGLSTTPIAAGSSQTGTVGFTASNGGVALLNGVQVTGALSFTAAGGSTPGTTGAGPYSYTLSTTVSGNTGNGTANIGAGQTYGTVAAPLYISRGTGQNTTVSFLGGTASTATAINVTFANADSVGLSDQATITGTGTDLHVVEMSYNPALLPITSPATSVTLGWLNSGLAIFQAAAYGNSDHGATSNEILGAYTSADFVLGDYGVDTTNNEVWAVVDSTGTYEAISRIPGDINGDGVVDTRDFNIWFADVGDNTSLYSLGDLNGDGVVDTNDFNVWFANVGDSISGAIAGPQTIAAEQSYALGVINGDIQAVPEPASLGLLALGGVGLLLRRKRRKDSKIGS